MYNYCLSGDVRSFDKVSSKKWLKCHVDLEAYLCIFLSFLLLLFFGAQIGLIDLNGSENKRWNYLFSFSFLLSFQVNKGSNNHVVYCDALRKTRGVSEAALACRYFLARTRCCSNFTEENETHTRDNREEFNSCKICDCSSSWEKWTEGNRNKMKYTAVITSVFSYP